MESTTYALPATPKQIAYARALALRNQTLLPWEVQQDLRALSAEQVMHSSPRLVQADALAVDAAALMEQHRITSVLVVDAQGLLVGALNSNDLMRAKVI